MWLPARTRVCSLAASASLLTGACGGQFSTERQLPAGSNAGNAGSGPSARSAGVSGAQGGSLAAGGSGGSMILIGGAGGTGGTSDGGCALDCSDTSYCDSCVATMGAADSCVLDVTANATPSQVVSFDCSYLSYGDDGFTVNELGQIVLTGEVCAALKTDAPHRIDVVLGCPLDK